MNQTKVYALLVGINQYADPTIRPLKGCLNDVQAMHAYLESQESLDLKLEQLTDSTETKPTKKNIVDAIESHLTEAKTGDVVLFYFAGHGIQEKTDIPAFQRAEVGGLLEALVCIDSRGIDKGDTKYTCLADKELRFLIHKVAKNGAHVLTIFDCCHSGNVDRSFGESRIARQDPLPSRGWEGFIFHNHISPDDLGTYSLPELIPQGRHIHIAACRDVELAWEYTNPDGKKCGLFTYCLLNFLRSSAGSISYKNLQSRLLHFMRGWQKKRQTPQVYAFPADESLLYQEFLGRTSVKRSIGAEIIYNPTQGWTLNLGSFHGLGRVDESSKIQIYLNTENEEIVHGSLSYIGPGYSLVSTRSAEHLDKRRVYRVQANTLFAAKIKICIVSSEENKIVQSVISQLIEVDNTYFLEIVSEIQLADYIIRVNDMGVKITLNQNDKPLVAVVEDRDSSAVKLVYSYLCHIAQWEFIQQLRPQLKRGATPDFAKYPIEIQLIQIMPDGTEELNVLNKPRLELELNHVGEDGNRYGRIKFKFINRSRRQLFVCPIYLSMTFGADPTLLEQGIWLDPGDEIYALEGDELDITLDPYIYQYQWEGSTEYLKLIVSTAEFDIDAFYLDELPQPFVPGRDPDPNRASFTWKRNKLPSKRDEWAEVTIPMFIRNPEMFAGNK